MDNKKLLIIGGIIVAVYVVILIIGGIGSVGSSTGHFVKDITNGTFVEQPAASIEKAGTDLTTSANHAFGYLTGFLVLCGLIWVGANKK
ncbi:MAG: hypothetical protein CVV30_09960 [Methanomicrobiales archaeon HGW-Methanomicrobiales-1]|nr:MAG: hypothetical protein CVV30_09960 [Methanomicrobiales archaeon HGW-Methanomicrobiales-1]